MAASERCGSEHTPEHQRLIASTMSRSGVHDRRDGSSGDKPAPRVSKLSAAELRTARRVGCRPDLRGRRGWLKARARRAGRGGALPASLGEQAALERAPCAATPTFRQPNQCEHNAVPRHSQGLLDTQTEARYTLATPISPRC